jgi:hypothetical protein
VSITIDMAIARNIHRDRIRTARTAALTALDVAYVRAQEQGADTTTIVAQKQELRDAPADPAIDAATTPAELKAVWNPLLGASPYTP